MRSAWRLAGLLSLVLLVGGCDTTQPLQLNEQTFELEVRGVTAIIASYDVWDMYEDLNLNGQRDDNEPLYLFCKTKNAQIILSRSVPYSFAIELSVLRADQTEPEVITSDQSFQLASNLTLYDDSDPRYGSTAERDPITLSNRTFRFINPRLVSAARQEVLAATVNPLYTLAPATYGLGNGLCSRAYPGDARIDNQLQPTPITLNKGDTLLVKLRRGDTAPLGLALLPNGEPAIRATLLLNGRAVVVRGETLTSKVPGDEISFSYTAI